jgi:hypothetical protein
LNATVTLNAALQRTKYAQEASRNVHKLEVLLRALIAEVEIQLEQDATCTLSASLSKDAAATLKTCFQLLYPSVVAQRWVLLHMLSESDSLASLSANKRSMYGATFVNMFVAALTEQGDAETLKKLILSSAAPTFEIGEGHNEESIMKDTGETKEEFVSESCLNTDCVMGSAGMGTVAAQTRLEQVWALCFHACCTHDMRNAFITF